MRLDYQPIMRARPDVSDVPRYEVLLRMLDDDGSVILPGAFIPDAEREGLAPTLDRWVIDAALAYLADGHGAADEARELCSVNISGASLDDPGLADDIRDMLERHGVPPAALCLEITETAAIASLATARHFIERLRALGCSFALDDFGSGLSSFAYLKALPVDYVKIDGAFVTDMADDPSCVVMVRAISEVATGVGARTIAEFVEDERTIEWLRSLGVEYVQGYAVGHPSPLAGRERPLVKPTMAAL